MQELFKAAVERGASDIHIKPGDFMRARVHGILQPLTQQKLSVEQVRGIALQLIPHEEDRQNFDKILDYDCSWGIPGVGRFRVNIMKQRGSPMIVMRAIPIEIPSVEDLGLPPIINKIAAAERGLILVTGVTGSGKSSTMAAMINWINRNKQVHVVTLENPIEFLHRDNKASITQRDIGTDTDSFATGLRAVLRQDPDVILIGEMRDRETIGAALTIAETGHLALATLHTNSTFESINRIVDVFPPEQQNQVRSQLSFSLAGVITQQLIPRQRGGGRVLALEIMVCTPAIKAMIRDNKTHQIYGHMQAGQKHGMQTMNQSLYQAVENRWISLDTALGRSPDQTELLQMLGEPVGTPD
jgi:twitching motility protein PilT